MLNKVGLLKLQRLNNIFKIQSLIKLCIFLTKKKKKISKQNILGRNS